MGKTNKLLLLLLILHRIHACWGGGGGGGVSIWESFRNTVKISSCLHQIMRHKYT